MRKMEDLKKFGVAFAAAFIVAISAGDLSAQTKSVADGSPAKLMGIITSRSSDSFEMKELSTSDKYLVDLDQSTEVETYKKGAFRGGKEYAASYLLRGLRVQVEGVGNAAGHLVARSINFSEDDLKTAQALEARVDPVEEKADRAQASADRANNRINGLDEFESVKTIVVPFATGSFALGPKGKGIIDEAAAWTKGQNTKGWVVAVVGFADSTGNTAKNKSLSEKRANAVIGYLVSKHNLQLTKLVQPFGAGVDDPVATNSTAAGRAQNRRVEIRLLVNKGIAGE